MAEKLKAVGETSTLWMTDVCNAVELECVPKYWVQEVWRRQQEPE